MTTQVVLVPSREAATDQLAVGDIPREAPDFQPRPDLLAKLDRSSRGVHVLTGTPGAGSTQLAAAYAREKLAAGWRLVAWINAGNTGNLMAGLAVVADAAGLSEGGSGWDVAEAGQAVRRWLEDDGDDCLLVFDDVADPEVLRPYVPAGDARVLITGLREPANLGTGLPVGVFSDDEALAFLARRTGMAEAEAAASVAAELGHLPVALAQAATVIGGQRLRYGPYLDRLRALSAQYPAGQAGEAYPQGAAEAVRLSLRAVRAADRTGMCIRAMEIISVLSAAGTRRDLLHIAGQAGLLASGDSRVAAGTVDRVLEWLSNRSLLTLSLDGQTVTMHGLVARVINDGLTRQNRLAVCWSAASALEAHAGALAGSRDGPAVRAIPQQVASLLDNAAGLAEASEELAEILLRLRFDALYHLLELGDSNAQAIEVGEPLTADLERMLGPDHPVSLNARNSLAAAYLAAGQAAEAIPLFEQTLAIRQRRLGPDHPDALTSQNNLAAAYQDAGRPADAIRLYELNLAARERLLGPDHPGTLNSRGNLATAYRAAGRSAEAIPLFEQALAGREQVLGPDHADTRTSRKNLAAAYRDVGRDADATRVLGPDHADTRTPRKNLAAARRDQGRTAGATPPVEQAPAAPGRQPPAGAAGRLHPAGVRRPPAAPARRVLPAGVRRPPAVAPRRVLLGGARPAVNLNARSSPARTPGPPTARHQHDREIAAAIRTGDPAAISMAYDRYAAALYGYCRSMLPDLVGAAEAMGDTFVITAATLSSLPEAPELRPWLYTRARDECQRLLRSPARTRGQQPDPVGLTAGIGEEPPAARLRTWIDAILGELRPREREVIELSFRHDLPDAELAQVLGMPGSRTQALAARTRVQLEEALRALRMALAGRDACPVLGELLADWDGQLTEHTRDLVGWHIEQCQTCARPGPGALRPAALAGLLPLAPLPPQLRKQVLDRCSAATEEAAAYRRRVARRAETTWFTAFSQAIRMVSWHNVKANPGMATATAAVAVWVLAAVSITLFTVAGSRVASARTDQPAARISASPPAAAVIATATPTAPATRASSAARRALSLPSLARQPQATSPAPLLVQSSSLPPSSPSPGPSTSPSAKPSTSPSAKPSTSPSAKPSTSPSATPSPSPSASPSRSPSPSPSRSSTPSSSSLSSSATA